MLQTSRRRACGSQEGFTLIELMVVVLIIAILLAIAIPTFLGARGKAQARGAQSNLRNALTGEKTIFADSSAYSNDVTATGPLFSAEPSIKWVATGTAQPKGSVGVKTASVNGTNDNLQLSAVDPSGTKCWWVSDEANPGANQPGTFYGFTTVTAPLTNACPGMTIATGPLTATPAAVGPQAAGVWGTSW